eukprot:11201147-Lingulodinium_polyedra.AAC.1
MNASPSLPGLAPPRLVSPCLVLRALEGAARAAAIETTIAAARAAARATTDATAARAAATNAAATTRAA